jgi:hypothetical protein
MRALRRGAWLSWMLLFVVAAACGDGEPTDDGDDGDGDGVLALLRVSANAALRSLEGAHRVAQLDLTGLLSIGRSLFITGNDSLDTLAGLDALTSVGDEVSLRDNPLLSSEEIRAFLERLGF